MIPREHLAEGEIQPLVPCGFARRATGGGSDAGGGAGAVAPATRRPEDAGAHGRHRPLDLRALRAMVRRRDRRPGSGGGSRGRRIGSRGIAARAAACSVAAALAVAAIPGVGSAAAAPQTFTDLASVRWAVPAIEGMAALGVMRGTSPGVFDPQGTTTRAQAAVIFARFMGWTPPASTHLPFTDAASIPSWAQASVAAAVQQGVLRGEADGAFHPNDPVTWDQMATIISRTFGYAAVSPGQAPGLLAQLPHGAATPSWATSAVAADVQAGDFPGALAAAYQADQPVTRAAMAAFLLAAAPSGANPHLLSGRVTAVSGDQLAILTPSGAVDLPASSQAAVYVGASLSSAAGLAAGDSLQVVTSGGQVVWADVTAVPAGSPAAVSNPAPPASSTQPTVATLRFNPAPVAPTGSLAAGSSVSVVLEALSGSGQPVAGTSIDLTFQQAPGGGSARIGGTALTSAAQAFTTDGNGRISITYIAPANPAAPGTDSILANYTAGGSAVVAEDGYAFTAAPAGAVPNSTLTGTIEAVNGSQSITLQLTGGSTTVLVLAPYVTVTLNGLSGTTASLAAGQNVTVTVDAQGQAGYVAVSTAGTTVGSVTPNTTVTGTIEAVDGAVSLTLAETGGQVVQITLAPYVTVTLNGQSSSIGAIVVGDHASVTVNAQAEASFVGVSSLGTSGSLTPDSTVTGTVESVNAGESLTLAVVGGPAVTVPLAPGVIVTYNGQNSTLAVVGTGDTATVSVNAAGQISSINVSSSGYPYPYSYPYGSSSQLTANSTVTATVDAIQWPTSITLALSGGPVTTAAIAPYATVDENGLTVSPSAIAVGATVTVSTNNLDQVATVEVQGGPGGLTPNSTLTGTVQAIDGTQTVTLSSTGGSSIVLPLASALSVSLNGSSAAGLGDLAIGDTVTATLNSLGQVSALNVTSSVVGGGTAVTGYLAGIDASAGSLQVYGSGATSGLQTYTLASGAAVDLNGQASSLPALAVGDSVSLALNDADNAAVVSAATPVPPETAYTGVLEATPTGTTVSLNTSSGPETLNVGSEAVAVRGGALVILSSLTAGENVTVVTQAGPLGSALILATS